MLKKNIKYTDYNGEERSEDFYFNLSKAEVMEMELGTVGGMADKLKSIIASKDSGIMFETFKDIILKSYGEKTPDGKRFIKSKELSDAFSQTEAYSELFMELATDAESAANFMNAVIPKGFDNTNSKLSTSYPHSQSVKEDTSKSYAHSQSIESDIIPSTQLPSA